MIISRYSTTPIETEISITNENDEEEASSVENPHDNDYLLALMLQHEYNNEFNGMMKKYESTVNRNSKGRIKKKLLEKSF